MTQLMPFNYDGQQIRSVVIDDEPWFVAADVARILGYRDAHNLCRRLDDDERGTRSVSTPSGDQDMTVISEPGLYVAILASQVPGAKDFKRWVTHEVLPQIRRTRKAAPSTPGIMPTHSEALRGWAAEIEAREAAEQRNVELSGRVAELAPSASAWQELAAAEGDFDSRAAAQVLCRAGIDTGQIRLRESLRQLGWTDRSNRPYQRHVDCWRLTERVTKWTDTATGSDHVTYQLRITPKGLGELRELLAAPRLSVIEGGSQ